MGEDKKTKNLFRVMTVTVVVLFVALIVLAAMTINLISKRSRGTVSEKFDLERLTSDKTSLDIDMAKYLTPEFIGIVTNGEKNGVSVTHNTVNGLYRLICPVISSVMKEENITESGRDVWDRYDELGDFIYIRYHSTLPDNVIGLAADACAGAKNERNLSYAGVYEMMIIPYGTENKSIAVVVRDIMNNTLLYEKKDDSETIIEDDIAELARSYRMFLYSFDFAGDRFHAESPTEPVFTEALSVRNIIMSNQTASLIYNSEEEKESLLRIFAFNPDKVQMSVSEKGEENYIDVQGVLYFHDSSFEYIATAGGGIDISNIIGYTSNPGLKEYILSAAKIYEDIYSLNRFYAGGDAEIYLSSVQSQNGDVTLVFDYKFDNIKITDSESAFCITFSGEYIKYAKLYTMSVRNLGYRSATSGEWWLFDELKKRNIVSNNVSLVYRSDFFSPSIEPEWAASVIKSVY